MGNCWRKRGKDGVTRRGSQETSGQALDSDVDDFVDPHGE